MKSEITGKLDGILEIIPPSAPAQSEMGVWILSGLLCTGLVLLAIYYFRYRKRPLQCARRLYRELVRQSSGMESHQCGESLIKILRLALNRRSLKMSDFDSYDLPIDRSEFQEILDHCSHIRFSASAQQSTEFQRVLLQTKKILWMHR